MSDNQRNIFLFLSCLVSIFIICSSYEGLSNLNFYSKETLNWRAQSIGQDMINLFLICPSLLISTCMIVMKKEYAYPVWAGTLLYLIYTYQIYCFNIHFNSYFIFYCLILGLSFYLFTYFIYKQLTIANPFHKYKINKITALYFMVLAVLFYISWLSDILPAIVDHTTPKSIREAGLVTNPIHVLDLSIILPGIFMTGVCLFKGKPIGILFTPILLTFFILMDLTIALLTIVMINQHVESNYTMVIVMICLAVFSSFLFLQHLKLYKKWL